MAAVADTNLFYVADKKSDPVDLPCFIACVDMLDTILNQQERLVVDWGREILLEYLTELQQPGGQPGVGTRLVLWLQRNWGNVDLVDYVTTTPTADGYAEYPTDPAFASFDPSDRKFVAVAISHPAKPPIYNATDSDWLTIHATLEQHHAVRVIFLCPDLIAAQS